MTQQPVGFADGAPALFSEGDAPTKGRKAKLQALGRQAIGTLYMLVRNVRMYDADNAIFAQPLEQLRETINTVIAVDGKFDLAAAGTVLSLNGTMIAVDFSSLENIRSLTNELKAREMGGLQASRPVQLAELKAFLRAFVAPDAAMDTVDGLVNIKVARYRAIVEQLHKKNEEEIQQHRKIDRKKYAFAVYARAVAFMRRFSSAVKTHDELPQMAPAVRLVRDFVDICTEQKTAKGAAPPERNLFLGMSTTRQSDEYLAYHSVNTCLTSIAVGHELGLSREQLFDLGRAALFHDVGAAGADQTVMNRVGSLTQAERTLVAQNPLIAAKLMLRARPIDLGALRCIVAAHEAKQTYFRVERDAQGQVRWSMQHLGLYGRIIRVASTYDALTSSRPFREAFTPDVALSMMCTQMKHEFDPHLLATFVKILAGIEVAAPGASTYSVAGNV
jgi:HD-GYP domain-containing protein (c-di-GMP phosphodiesterase class II)